MFSSTINSRRWRLQGLPLRALMLLLCLAAAARAGESGAKIRPAAAAGATAVAHSLPIRPGESQLWLVSTRMLPGPGVDCDEQGPLEVYYLPCRGQAVQSSLAEFLATDDPQLPTIIYVHGNADRPADSAKEGGDFFRALMQSCVRPIRFVIWSWPSEHQQGLVLKDLRVKLARTDVEAFYLADFISAMPAKRSLGLIGFSFGSRIIAGGLHLLAGGTVNGRGLAAGTPSRRAPIRVIMFASALGNDALAPQGSHGRAMELMDRLVITVNRKDCVLHYFRLLRGDTAPALGFAGMSPLADGSERMTQVDVADFLGVHHAIEFYIRVPAIVELVRGEIETISTPAVIQ